MPDDKQRGSLFISYSRKDKAQVYPFADALTQAGIEVWIDREEIDGLDDFPERILDGLGHSHALLAWYSSEYAQSSFCQKELTAAWICAQRLSHTVLSRILVVNPEASIAHIALGDVGRQNYLAAPKDALSQAACIQAICNKLTGLSDDFGAVREFKPPDWHPSRQQGSAWFVGRLRELWRLHTALNPVGISDHENAGAVVQLRGLGGVGKSLLAIEYAKRFGASYPGGIHWLRAYGFDPDKPMEADARERERRTQIENLALGYDVAIREKDFREVVRDLGRKLGAGPRYLWIVDDLPPGLDQEERLPGWWAPSANGCTLITTRSGNYEGVGVTIKVDVLDLKPAVELLTREREPQTDQERREAEALAEDLGRHALALAVASLLLKAKGFAELREEVAAGSDPLGELAAGLSWQLPGGHEKSIVATLVMSVRLLGEQGLGLLRLAGVLHRRHAGSIAPRQRSFQTCICVGGTAGQELPYACVKPSGNALTGHHLT
jgi:TIR domain